MTLTPEDVELVASARMIADCADGDSSRKWYDTLARHSEPLDLQDGLPRHDGARVKAA